MKKLLLFAAILVAAGMKSHSAEEARLLRFPAVCGNSIVFSYAGDLYTVNKTGGMARKLTSDIGYEMFARFSPDGKNIAFTAQYDGNTEVYLIPSEGGVPKRLTYTTTLSRDDVSDRMGPNNIVMCWKDDGNIIYRSRKKSFNDFKGQLFEVSVNGGLSKELPLPCGGFCSYSPDKNKLAYNRVFREFRTWKYYKGGMADDIWIYDFLTKKIENITNNPAQDIMPMWKGNTIYFISDRDRTMNLFSYNIDTKETKKLTDFTEYDIKFPSLGDNCIVFENGGYIYVFDLNTQKTEKVSIVISDDFNSGRNELKDASKNINSISLSPDAKRVCISGRGDVFTVPASTGITRNLTKTCGSFDRNVIWSPDGKYIAFISDMSGEDEIYIMEQDGTKPPVKVTENADTYKFTIKWSPDSKKILWSDRKLRLQYVIVDTKEVITVDQVKDGVIRDYNWSPDSKWITYIRPEKEKYDKIYIYELASKNMYPVTDMWYGSGNPVFSRDGKYLLFVSSREFDPVYSWTEFNCAYVDMNKIYMIPLSEETSSPFKPVNDEVDLSVKKEDVKDNKSKEKPAESNGIKIKIDNIIDRIIELPVEASSYWNITMIDDNVYYMKKSYYDKKSSLVCFNIKEKKEEVLGEYNNYEMSSDNKKMLVNENDRYAIIDLPKSKIKIDKYINLSDMKIWVNMKEEWKEVYEQCWRQMRDFFYDPNMHGVNWKAIHDKYEPLVKYVNHRNDLTYIIGEMIGELNCGHAYVNGGDRPQIERINMGLLGAELSREVSGFYRIDKILKGQNWNEKLRSPLTETGLDIKEGDYIIEVNGEPADKMNDIYEALTNTAGKQVELTINNKPEYENSRKVIVIPVDNESQLYYYNWVENNIRKVSEATNGQVGYIHIPDMLNEGLNEFMKHFYPQLDKKAVIIDDRGNGGGNVSPLIIERLVRELVVMKVARNISQTPSPEMIIGPKVCLVDCYSASDGDLFPYKFKKLNIGKLIGMRTWGGVVGISGSLPVIDGGTLNKPEFAHYDTEGKGFVIEGHGVDPDIVIDNDPAKEYAGEDQQLNKAIELILEEMKNNKQELPPIPPFPDKSK